MHLELPDVSIGPHASSAFVPAVYLAGEDWRKFESHLGCLNFQNLDKQQCTMRIVVFIWT